ncbi:4Fe-4S dicluster domain-containing protein [Psittacicella hinzii]|uniref:Ion-translocating oxidoreductase complex subunit C n=1 Tax=Psittacicella hinzii TaxID=2028575 RepID=A0A3A1YH12_9GAMM|nr:4Fe-4S dicluster domain-containing protein [Psittacicella hinzii]RIY37533.1 hypothetical protein CKF58_04800 [Psittacicella hinzii]
MILDKIKSAFVQTAQRLSKRDIAVKLHQRLAKGKLYHFHGGLHLELGKDLTSQAPIAQIGELNYYFLNMRQHKGPKPICVVEPEQEVVAGQLLTSNYIPGELPVHSPVAGKVVAIQDFLQANEITKTGPTIIIENQEQVTPKLEQIVDFSQGTAIGPAFYEPLNYFTTPRIDLLWRIKNSGIAGMGGAVFPSARKINNRHFKSLIINAAECEPYITCDDVLMQHYATQLMQAIACMQHILQTEQVIVAVEDDKPQAIAQLETALTQSISNAKQELLAAGLTNELVNSLVINTSQAAQWTLLAPELQQKITFISSLEKVHIRVIPTRYPSGNQRTTIEVLTGLRLTKKQNLTSLGAICFNIATIYAMHRAIAYGEVLTRRLVTVTGKGIKRPGNYWLPFGTTPTYLLNLLGASEEFTQQVIVGGPMMGFKLDDLNTPINKGTNCLIFVGTSEAQAEPKLFAPAEEQACIRCTACQEVCPMLLQPQQLYWYEKDKDDKKLIKANLSTCIECGLCDYVCPSNIPLVSYFQQAKFRIFHERQKAAMAEESKQRYEIKSAREKAAKELRDAKRAADKARNQARAQQMREQTIAYTGIDPIEAAKARLRAKGITTGQTTAVDNQAQPDNAAIMEMRRQRRLAAQQAKADNATGNNAIDEPTVGANASNSTAEVSNTNASKLDRSAVLAAVARAKARAQGNTGSTSNVEAPNTANTTATDAQASSTTSTPVAKTAVQLAVERAKARQAAAQAGNANSANNNSSQATSPSQAASTSGSTSTSTPAKSAVQLAVEKAKARQAAALAAQQNATSSASSSANANSSSQEEVVTSTEVVSEKKSAIQLAVERAKARQAQALAQQATQSTTPEVSTAEATTEVKTETQTSATSNASEAKKSAVQLAVERAKARQAQVLAQQATQASTQKVAAAETKTEATTEAKAETQNSATSNVSEAKKSAVQIAVERAKARQAQVIEQQATQTSTPEVTTVETTTEAKTEATTEVKTETKTTVTSNVSEAKKSAVQLAVERAKARQAQAFAQQGVQTSTSEVTTAQATTETKAEATAEDKTEMQASVTSNVSEAKKTAVQLAVERAKARQAQALAQQATTQQSNIPTPNASLSMQGEQHENH